MNLENLQSRLHSLDESDFKDFAISLFKYQSKNNLIYKNYLSSINCDVDSVSEIEEIRYLPIDFFKQHRVVTGKWVENHIFRSSGTTTENRSCHFVKDLELYHKNAVRTFEFFYGALEKYHFIALLPSYIGREDSSLISMVQHFIDSSGSEYSGFHLESGYQVFDNIQELLASGKEIILLGVSFALLELAEKGIFDLSGVTIIETGGMKGRRKEVVRAALHDVIKTRMNVQEVHSEYGMTELLSQAYGKNGHFFTPPWMKVSIREVNDPFALVTNGGIGGINVIDLANLHTCAFIETQDLGLINPDSSFQVVGRFDNSEIRGCNLLLA